MLLRREIFVGLKDVHQGCVCVCVRRLLFISSVGGREKEPVGSTEAADSSGDGWPQTAQNGHKWTSDGR